MKNKAQTLPKFDNRQKAEGKCKLKTTWLDPLTLKQANRTILSLLKHKCHMHRYTVICFNKVVKQCLSARARIKNT